MQNQRHFVLFNDELLFNMSGQCTVYYSDNKLKSKIFSLFRDILKLASLICDISLLNSL